MNRLFIVPHLKYSKFIFIQHFYRELENFSSVFLYFVNFFCVRVDFHSIIILYNTRNVDYLYNQNLYLLYKFYISSRIYYTNKQTPATKVIYFLKLD